jgi:Rrf2 family protein
VRISAKADYAVRAGIALAAPDHQGPLKGDRIAETQGIPIRFLENILVELRHAGLVQSQRGADGGYWLARPAAEVTVAELIRAVAGPLATVRGERPEDLDYLGRAQTLRDVWVGLRANIREILETVTLADIVAGDLPAPIGEIVGRPEAWESH